MYIGAWQEYKLAQLGPKRKQPKEGPDKDRLNEYYLEWKALCEMIGEEEATKQMIWQPLMQQKEGEQHPARISTSQSDPGRNGDVNLLAALKPPKYTNTVNLGEQKRRREAKRRTKLTNMKALYSQHLKTDDAASSAPSSMASSSSSTPRTITPLSSARSSVTTSPFRVESQSEVHQSTYHSLRDKAPAHPSTTPAFNPKYETGKSAASSAASRLLGGGLGSLQYLTSSSQAPAPAPSVPSLPSSVMITQGGYGYNETDFNGPGPTSIPNTSADPLSAREEAFRTAYEAQYGGNIGSEEGPNDAMKELSLQQEKNPESPPVAISLDVSRPPPQIAATATETNTGVKEGVTEGRTTPPPPAHSPSHTVRMSPIQTPRDPVSRPLTVDGWDMDDEVDALLQWTDGLAEEDPFDI